MIEDGENVIEKLKEKIFIRDEKWEDIGQQTEDEEIGIKELVEKYSGHMKEGSKQ